MEENFRFPAIRLTGSERFHKLQGQCNIMTNTWEDVTWETETPRREWVVEYYAKVGSETTHHLSVLHGDGMEDVQRMLMQELRATYHEAQEIEVTVLRMEEIETEPNAAMFTGAYTP